MSSGSYSVNKIIVRGVTASTAGQQLLGWTSIPKPEAGTAYNGRFWISICVPTTGVAGAETQQCRIVYSMEDVNNIDNNGSCTPSGSFVLDASGAFSSIAAMRGKLKIASSIISYPVGSMMIYTSGSTTKACEDASIMTPSSAYTIWYGSY